jgi:arginyl-tRNA synthetase
VINEAWNKRAPDVICNYIYDLCVLFNAFYHKCPIVSEPNKKTKNSRINLCKMVLNAVENFAKIVGIFIPEKM